MMGRPRIWMRSIQKGTMPTQAEPSKVSTVRPEGSRRAICAVGSGQCAKRRSFQRWVMVQRVWGSGQGRCSTVERISLSSCSFTLPLGESCRRGGRSFCLFVYQVVYQAGVTLLVPCVAYCVEREE